MKKVLLVLISAVLVVLVAVVPSFAAAPEDYWHDYTYVYDVRSQPGHPERVWVEFLQPNSSVLSSYVTGRAGFSSSFRDCSQPTLISSLGSGNYFYVNNGYIYSNYDLGSVQVRFGSSASGTFNNGYYSLSEFVVDVPPPPPTALELASTGLASSLGWVGSVLDFVIDNLLPIIGLTIALGLVGFGIHKFVTFIRGA